MNGEADNSRMYVYMYMHLAFKELNGSSARHPYMCPDSMLHPLKVDANRGNYGLVECAITSSHLLPKCPEG